MKGKQAILRYLETHRTFTAKDVAAECGMTINCITKNALELEKVNKLVRISKVWRTVPIGWLLLKSSPVPRTVAPTEYSTNAETARR